MEEILVTLQRKHENKVADLQTTVDKLLKVGFPTHMGFICSSFFFRLFAEGVFPYFMKDDIKGSFLGKPLVYQRNEQSFLPKFSQLFRSPFSAHL